MESFYSRCLLCTRLPGIAPHIQIFSEDGNQLLLVGNLLKYLNLQVTSLLPQTVCQCCLEKLQVFIKLMVTAELATVTLKILKSHCGALGQETIPGADLTIEGFYSRCLLCTCLPDVTHPHLAIISDTGNQIQLAGKLYSYLSIEISKMLPQNICQSCLENLEVAVQLLTTVKQSSLTLQLIKVQCESFGQEGGLHTEGRGSKGVSTQVATARQTSVQRAVSTTRQDAYTPVTPASAPLNVQTSHTLERETQDAGSENEEIMEINTTQGAADINSGARAHPAADRGARAGRADEGAPVTHHSGEAGLHRQAAERAQGRVQDTVSSLFRTSSGAAIQHKHKPGKFPCPNCLKMFYFPANVSSHIRSEHSAFPCKSAKKVSVHPPIKRMPTSPVYRIFRSKSESPAESNRSILIRGNSKISRKK